MPLAFWGQTLDQSDASVQLGIFHTPLDELKVNSPAVANCFGIGLANASHGTGNATATSIATGALEPS